MDNKNEHDTTLKKSPSNATGPKKMLNNFTAFYDNIISDRIWLYTHDNRKK